MKNEKTKKGHRFSPRFTIATILASVFLRKTGRSRMVISTADLGNERGYTICLYVYQVLKYMHFLHVFFCFDSH